MLAIKPATEVLIRGKRKRFRLSARKAKKETIRNLEARKKREPLGQGVVVDINSNNHGGFERDLNGP